MNLGGLFESFGIALEADDITARVANTMNGGRNQGQEDTAAPGNNNRDEDLTNTNILDAASQDEPTEADQDQGENTPDDNADVGAADDTNNPAGGDPLADPNDAGGGDEEGGGDITEDDFSGDEGGDSEELNDNDSPGNSNNPPSVFSDKNTLKKSCIHFSNIITGDIAMMSDRTGNFEDPADIQIWNKIISNLTLTQTILDKMITEEFNSRTYEDLMTRYITMKQIYDVCQKMLDKHFNKDPKRRGKATLRGARKRDLG